MSHRQGGRLNLTTLPLAVRQREQQGIVASVPILIPRIKCFWSFVPPLLSPVARVMRHLKSTHCRKMKAYDFQSARPGQNPFRSAVTRLNSTEQISDRNRGGKSKGGFGLLHYLFLFLFLTPLFNYHWVYHRWVVRFFFFFFQIWFLQSILGSSAIKPESARSWRKRLKTLNISHHISE